jgi:His/Glu/Gln/Arg/opine family amino acid ABC transporter permease subunit
VGYILSAYSGPLLSGALTTLELAAIVWGVGLGLGIVIGTIRAWLPPFLKGLSALVFSAVSSVPILVYLLWFHYPLQAAFRVVVNPFVTSAFVLSMYNAVTISELVKGSIEGFPSEFREVARVNGLSRTVFAREIMTPMLTQGFLPGYLSSQVAALHLTLFASLISVDELFRVAQRINSLEYNAVTVFSLLAIFYFVLSFPLLLLSRWLARHQRDVWEDT